MRRRRPGTTPFARRRTPDLADTADRQVSFVSRFVKARRVPHDGFTLVEMMVAVALVLLMMLMFAEIFKLAGGSITTQRGIAENDQRARSLIILLRGDLDKRTFRLLVPFQDGEDTSLPGALAEQRVGYFYISENDPNSDIDDVLQFTVRSTVAVKNQDETPYYGKAAPLTGDEDGNGNLTPEFVSNPNQPSTDDGQINWADMTGTSTAAEVSYFLRAGTLYRRVLLIRDPLPLSGTTPQPAQEFEWDSMMGNFVAINPAENFFNPNLVSAGGGLRYRRLTDPSTSNEITTGDFWNDFDYSVFSNMTFNPMGNFVDLGTGVTFHGLDSLDNQPNVTLFPLADPRFRFGHNRRDGAAREFVDGPGPDGTWGTMDDTMGANNGRNSVFMGRFTQQETSHEFFNYPQWPSAVDTNDPPAVGNIIGEGNPMEPATMPLWLADGIVRYDGSGNGADGIKGTADDPGFVAAQVSTTRSRRAEDIVLPNVLSFDIKVWDEAVGNFVDIGDLTLPSMLPNVAHFHPANTTTHLNATYGSNGANGNNVFDTWHPNVDFGAGAQPPPYRPSRLVAGNPVPVPMRSIQITIRFLDQSTGQERQMTLVHSLVD